MTLPPAYTKDGDVAVGELTENLTDQALTKFELASGKLVDSGANVLPNGNIRFDNSIEVPSGTVGVGEVLGLSEGVVNLVLANFLKNKMAFSVNSDFAATPGSSVPSFLNFGADFVLNINTDDSQTLTANPLTFQITGTVATPDERLINKITFRTGGAMNNFRVKVTDNATGKALRYIPNQAAFEGRQPGLNLISGDNTLFLTSNAADTPGNFNLGFVPFIIEDSQLVDLEIVADSVNIKGNISGLPFLIAGANDGPPTSIIGEDIKSLALVHGCTIAATPGETTFDVASGEAEYFNSTDPVNPISKKVTISAFNNVALTELGTSKHTYILLDLSGATPIIVQIGDVNSLTSANRRSLLYLGVIRHGTGTVVGTPINQPQTGQSIFGHVIDLYLATGKSKNFGGNELTVNGTNTLAIDKASGQSYVLGGNFINDPNNPDIVSSGPLAVPAMLKYSGQGHIQGQILTNFDTSRFDDGGTSVLDADLSNIVGGSTFVAHRIWMEPITNLIIFQYGQATYSSEAEAISKWTQEDLTLPTGLAESSHLHGVFIIINNETDLNNSTLVPFTGAGGGGGTSVTVIDDLLSIDSNSALSANQGRVLDEKITTSISNPLTRGEAVQSVSPVALAIFPTFTPVTGASVILPGAGTYRIVYSGRGTVVGTSEFIIYRMFDVTGNAPVPNTRGICVFDNGSSGNNQSTVTMEQTVTVMVPTTIRLEAGSNAVGNTSVSDTNGITKISFQQLPSTVGVVLQGGWKEEGGVISQQNPASDVEMDGILLFKKTLATQTTADEALVVGEVLTFSGTTDSRVVKTTSASNERILGVAGTAATGAGSIFQMVVGGEFDVIINNTVARGNLLRSSAVAGRAESSGIGGVPGDFAVAMQSGTVGQIIKARYKKAEVF